MSWEGAERPLPGAPTHSCGKEPYGCWVDPELDDELLSRLHDHKFGQAQALLRPDHPELFRDLVTALAELLGSPGWGLEGKFGDLVDATLDMMRGCPHAPEPGREEEFSLIVCRPGRPCGSPP